MRHQKRGRKLKRTASHKKALMKNLATALFEHKRIRTTEAKAKELRPVAEKLITKAKNAMQREKLGQLPTGQTVDIHNRREVYKFIRSKAVLEELFDTIAPLCEERQGGYTRIVKTGFRRGDGGATAIIELVDFGNPVDGAASTGKKKKKKSAPKQQPVEAAPVEEVTPSDEVVEETVEALNEVEEEVIEEAQAEETTEAQAEETTEAQAEETTEAPAEEKKEDEEKKD